MKINKQTLRQIIKEELSNVLLEEEISNIENLDEGMGTTFAMLMSMWTGMAGDDNSLTVNGLDGETMEISKQEFEAASKFMDKLANGANAPAVEKSIEVMKDIDGSGQGPRSGLLDLNNVYGDNAAQVMDAVFHKVDGKYDNAELSVGADQPSADIPPDKIEKTQSPNGKDQLVVSAGGKLTQDQIQKIASANGITSYTVNNNTGSGPVFITAN